MGHKSPNDKYIHHVYNIWMLVAQNLYLSRKCFQEEWEVDAEQITHISWHIDNTKMLMAYLNKNSR